jgi:hypothetical protein
MYFTYRITQYAPEQEGHQDTSTRDDNTVSRSAWQQWRVTVQIDLHNSQDGMYELAACCLAVKHNPTIRNIFAVQSCAYIDTQQPSITNESTWDDDLDETNEIVEQITIGFTIGDEDVTAQAGYVLVQSDTGSIEISGTATLTEG